MESWKKHNRKILQSKCKNYRITIYSESFGIKLDSERIYATVKCGDTWLWAGPRRAFHKINPAKQACKRNRRLWEKFLKLGQAGGNKVERLENLIEKSKSGHGVTFNRILALPCPNWVIKKASKLDLSSWILRLKKK